jgi:transposase InsO family protein
MHYSQPEKMEIIRMVERAPLSVRRTLQKLGINRSTFYTWYRRYLESGPEGLSDGYHPRRQTWNRIPPWERDNIVTVALEHPEKSPRELAWYITDHYRYFVSESSVYRILKERELITCPAFTLVSARDKFPDPTTAVNELWQTDFTYLKVISWGWYYLSTVMDDYSRYIISWRLCSTMQAEDVRATLDEALEATGTSEVKVRVRTRLLSDNGPCYVSSALRDYLERNGIQHIRGKPLHPMTQGKIERYHRSLKSIICLDTYYSPGALEDEIGRFVAFYNNYRYHESLDNVTPSDVYHGRKEAILKRRKEIKSRTGSIRRWQNDTTNLDATKQKGYIVLTKTTS